ncbi:hypothetical protein BOTNAR_0066g00430 [Botryotinia narcissicola]|uniref:Uncharacterized protein n=1 Tax=Botryotinia narcissicola TaxID=278944 RepID=A0A4Z1JAN0_9HELO|nr:hypothetical protein BOTNAR_0066g00430 [Botryotinia narcissicola]
MRPSKRLRLLLSQMPIEAFGDSEDEIQASQPLLQGVASEIENVDLAWNNVAQDTLQRHITSAGATDNHETTERVTASIFVKKEGAWGDATGDLIEEVATEVSHENLVQNGTANEEVAKESDFEDIVVKGATEQDTIGKRFSEEDTAQVDLISLSIDLEDNTEKNNIEKGVIAEDAAQILMETSDISGPNHDFENSEAYYHIILKMDRGAIDKEAVKVEREDDEDV